MAELGRMHTVSPEERRKLAREVGSSTPLGNSTFLTGGKDYIRGSICNHMLH